MERCENPPALPGTTKEEVDTSTATATTQLDKNDPLHPHNLPLVRKWLAVVTVSTGSLCV